MAAPGLTKPWLVKAAHEKPGWPTGRRFETRLLHHPLPGLQDGIVPGDLQVQRQAWNDGARSTTKLRQNASW